MLQKFSLLFTIVLFSLFSCSNKFDGKDGIKTVYFPDSEIIQQIVEYKDGKRIGEFKEYYRNGTLKVRQFYKNDTLNDSCFFYHENGKIKYFQYLKNFKKEGTWKKYNKEGIAYEEVNYKNDERDGYSTKYTYRTGKLLERLNYKEGLKDGKQEFYHNNGKLKAIAYYHNNKPLSGLEEWDEHGKKIDNDFKITVREENKLLLENALSYIITLENPKPNDEVYMMSDKISENYLLPTNQFTKIKDEHWWVYRIPVGGFIMETIQIGAYRKTSAGNIFVKTKSISVSANNY